MRRLPATREECDALLALWEHGLVGPAWERGDRLLEHVEHGRAPRTLGERTTALLRLHARLFGAEVDLLSHCPACRSAAHFTASCEALIDSLPQTAPVPSHRLDVEGVAIEFRLPAAADLAAAFTEDTDEAFARRVLDCCVISCTRHGEHMPLSAVPDAVLDAVSRRMETLDPAAVISFAMTCPECAARWNAPLDTGRLVWENVQFSAERLLLDVDTLARAYGWTEREILSLSPVRRAAYLQLVTA